MRSPDRPRPPLVRSLAVGLVAGLMSGVFGVGGGVVLVPALTALLGFGQHAAHATSLAAIVLTAAAGVVGFATRGSVDFVLALPLAVGAVGGALLGARLMRRVSARWLKIAFALLLLAVTVQLALGVETAAAGGDGRGVGALVGGLAVGIGTGVLSALLGVGGGAILVPALVLLFGLGQQTAEGTSLAVIVPTAVAGSVQHARHGYTDVRTGTVIGVAGAAGALAGAAVAHGLDPTVLQRLFAGLLGIVGIRMLVGAARNTA